MSEFFKKYYKHLILIFIPLFYVLTVSPTTGSADAALLLDRMMRLHLHSKVNVHNLANMFGHFFTKLPIGDIPYRINLMSAFFGTLTAILFYFLIYRLTKRYWISVLTTAILVVSHSLWWHSTIVECYAINTTLFMLIFHFYVSFIKSKRIIFIYLSFLFAGLSIFNHVQNGVLLFTSIAVTIFYYKDYYYNRILSKPDTSFSGLFIKITLICALMYAIGLVPYVSIFIKNVLGTYERGGSKDLAKAFFYTFKRASGDDFTGMMFSYDIMAFGQQGWQYLNQFPSIFLPVSVYGIIHTLRTKFKYRRFMIAILAFGFLPTAIFYTGFLTWDVFAFMLPCYLITSIAGAFGFKSIFDKFQKKIKEHNNTSKGYTTRALYGIFITFCMFAIVFPPYFYSKIADWGKNPQGPFLNYNNIMFENSHDRVEYDSNPNKRNFREVDNFVKLLFAKLPYKTNLVDNGTRSYRNIHLYYRRYADREDRGRRDIRIIFIDVFGFGWGKSPKYVANRIKSGKYPNDDLFMTSNQMPNDKIINLLDRNKYIFVPYKLDNDHWIYKLKTLKKKPDFVHIDLHTMHFGQNMGKCNEMEKQVFDKNDDIMIRLWYAKNKYKDNIPIVVKLYNPQNQLISETKDVMPLNSKTMYTKLNKGKMPQLDFGTYNAVLYIDGQKIFERHFYVK